MPLYEYAPLSGECKQCHGVFEVVQRIADDKLTHCPTCGQDCERRISAVALGGRYSTSDSAVKAAGFTKYRNAGDGTYEKVAGGSGEPNVIRRDGSAGDS